MINITSKPISTVDNPLWWRIWHGTNYMLGGIFFILGSMCYFPSISEIINGDVLGGWLFTIGKTIKHNTRLNKFPASGFNRMESL